jgi:hypothetical protein
MLLRGDLTWNKCATPPLDFATANVGGAISAGPTPITGTTIGEVFFDITPDQVGGSDLIQISKVFARNGNSTSPAIACTCWGENFLDDVGSTNTVTLQSDSILDTSDYFARIIGFDGSGNPISADRAMNGISAVTTVLTFGSISRIEYRLVLTGALTTTNGNVTVKSGSTTIGFVPQGLNGANSEQYIAMEAVQNGSTTIADCQTAPSPSFFKPRTRATALSFSEGGTLLGNATPNRQGVWRKLSIPAATLGSSDAHASIILKANVA